MTSTPNNSEKVAIEIRQEKALIRKVDYRLIPWLSFLYLLSFLDRTSIGNASLYGLKKDLKISDQQYLWALTIFFFSYATFEVPSNVLLKRLKPHLWLSFLMIAWGIVMTCQGLVKNWKDLMAVRFLLGMAEAGLFPGVSYYLSCWYKRSEFGLRVAIFFSAATASGAFGGLLAAAISQMHGVGGKPGWAWIFILEGLITVVAGMMSYWLVEDFPDDAKFLTDRERAFIIGRLQTDDQFSAGGEAFSFKYVWNSLTDWKTWLGMLCYAGWVGPLYAFALFAPSIINQLGYRATPANLLSVPIYVWAAILTVGVGYMADRTGHRGWYNLGFSSLGVVGYAILIASRHAGLSYFATYLAASGIYPVIREAWMSNNVEGSYKRSVSLGIIISFGNINGAVSSNIYRAKDKPWYRLGHTIVLVYIIMGIITSLLFHFFLDRENEKRDRGERDERILDRYESEEVAKREHHGMGGTFVSLDEARREKGDEWSGYRYTL
ncbi:MFS general substrate transporter [Cantharellus anzutake]|uniref:MFS general substrate transporter n=1 Tax=Cantharellus anzutake TaxID=1750568 RepID=UPI0019047422|nr:MFS general substrate transporter [Cantharellus anzutake]KAF8340726.1 MFS general substrate transporter [Cantharellus anzutake]